MDDLVVKLWVKGGKAQILQLPLDGVHAQAVGQRSENLKGLLGDTVLLVGTQKPQRAHIVQPICQLDDENSNISAHRDNHLANGLSLRRIPILDLVKLGDPINEEGDFFTEIGSELFVGVGSVLDGVMQEAGA